MDKIDYRPIGSIAPGTVPMAKIDGTAIRRLRESKGLTQLYLATVIGVTTDTISRWENRRYPAIKLDNAERLAEALEVNLEAILEQGLFPDSPADELSAEEIEESSGPSKLASPPPPLDDNASPAPPRRDLNPWIPTLVGLAALAVLGLILWAARPAPPSVSLVGERILPDHVPAGQNFPVLIRVTTTQQGPISLILRETIPPGSRLIGSVPPCTSVDAGNGVLKWVSRTDTRQTTFAYLIQAPVKGNEGGGLRFNGGVTLNLGDKTEAEITMAATMTMAPYHWADVDRDNRIDDEEILAVYDRYSPIEQLDFNRDLIDDIWAANGYVWNRKAGRYEIAQ